MSDRLEHQRRIRHYDDRWAALLELTTEQLARGERSLSRALRQVEARWRGTKNLEPVGGTVSGRTVNMPMAALIAGRQGLWRQVLLNACRPDTTLVVELGAGWGNNLLDLYVGGGPPSARYVALEPTENGRKCFELLAELEPALHASCAPFDFAEPDYSVLPRGHKHAVVFSSHSIEQIPELKRDVISKLFGLADSITGVHFEPVGFQIREKNGLPPAETGATREYCERKGYNMNFWRLLRSIEHSGDIAIRQVVPDIFCHKTKDASSLIVWTTNQ